MTEFERGRAAGMAEAVKVVRSYQDISNNGSWSVEKRKPNDMRGLALAFEIEALSTSPADNVLVPRHLLIEALLEKYRDEGVLNLDDTNVLRIAPFSAMGSVVQLINAFGGKEGFENAVHELQDALYQETA